MPYVRDFTNYRPGPRNDGRPWTQVRFDEAPDVDGAPGSWTALETQTISPVEPDPADPLVRDFTTEEATLTEGWYRLVFIDADGDEQLTDPVAFPPTITLRPRLDEVGSIIRRRTLSESGAELGTFTTATTPTGTEVDDYIDQAIAEVSLRLPASIPTAYTTFARRLIALRAAMFVELSYWPEQADEDNTVYAQLKEQFETGMRSLLDAVGDQGDGSSTWRAVAVPLTTPVAADSPLYDYPELFP